MAAEGGRLAKKTAASKSRTAGSSRKTAATAKSGGTAAARKKTTASTATAAQRSVKKHVGDVLGLSRAKVSKSVPSGGGRPKGIELAPRRRTGMKPARVVGGVRGRGR